MIVRLLSALACALALSSSAHAAFLGNNGGLAPDKLAATSCASGLQTGSDGTVSCLSAPGEPETLGYWFTNKTSSLQAYAVVKLNGSNAGQVIEATSGDDDAVIGCAQNTSSLATDQPVFVITSGIATCASEIIAQNQRIGLSTNAGKMNTVESVRARKVLGWRIDGGLTSPGTMLLFGGGFYRARTVVSGIGTGGLSTTERFFPLNGSWSAQTTTVATVAQRYPAGYLTRMFCFSSAAVTNNTTVKFYQNGSSPANWNCTISASGTTCSGTATVDVAIADGDLLAWSMATSSGTQSVTIGCQATFVAVP